MAPAMSRDSRASRASRILPNLLQQRKEIVESLVKILVEEQLRGETRKTTRNATYRFFCGKIDYLMRNGHISDVVGVPTDTFLKLLTMCKPRNTKIPNIIRVAVFLKFCREGMSETALSRDVGLSQPTVSRIIISCIRDIVEKAKDFIKLPTTRREITAMEAGFAKRRNAYGKVCGVPCYGVIDGKHWRINHPPNTGSLNFNYKAFFSFNSLFIADSESRIMYIQMSKLGTNSDAQIFNSGPLNQLLGEIGDIGGFRILDDSKTVMPYFILADNGFGLSKHVMTPFRANQMSSSNHIRCNEIISASRVKIENLFGILTSKFQTFGRNLRLDPKNSRKLIIACAVIHNMSLPPLDLSAGNDDDNSGLFDPYSSPEQQRTALMSYLLNR